MIPFNKSRILRFYKKWLLVTISIIFINQSGLAHWTSKGPFGGSISCFAVVDTLLYSGTLNGGIYWGKNKATASWGYVNYNGLGSGHITAISAIGSPASGYKLITSTSDKGIFISDNKGLSWSSSNNGLPTSNITALTNSGKYMIAGSSGRGIFISIDSAKNWIGSASNAMFNNSIITCFALQGNILFAGTNNNGAYISINNGATWIEMNNGLTDRQINSLAISGNNVYAGTPSGVFLINQLQTNWVPFNNGLTNSGINNLYESNGILYAASNLGVYAIKDGTDWAPVNTGYTDTVTAVIVFNNILYAGTKNDGIYRSTSISSVSWSVFNTGLNAIETYAVYNNGNLVIAATAKGVFVSRDLQANNLSSNTGLTDSLHVHNLTFAGSKLYAATRYAGIFCSSDTGKTWTEANSGLTDLFTRLIHATSSHLFVTTLSGDVYSSPIQAISWTKAQNLPDNLILSAITSSGSNVYLGSNHGVFQTNDAIHWNAFNAGLANTNITSLTSNNTFVFAGTNGGGIFRSGLVTNSWTAVNSGLPDLFITSLFTNGQYLIAGYKGGVHVSTSSGYQWLPPNVELYIPNYTDIIEISFNVTSTVPSTRIFIATAENMIYSNSISELPATASDPSLGIQHAIKNTGLLQVYPNPTNGSFTIDASELNEKLTSISIYDYSGKMIDTFSGDNHQFNVHYNPGIYLIHVCTTNNDVLIKKIIIQ